MTNTPLLLAPHHWRVAQLIHEGKTNKEIAAESRYSYNSVVNYTYQIMDLMDLRGTARNRVQVALAVERGEVKCR